MNGVRGYIASVGNGGFHPRDTDHSSAITATSNASSAGLRHRVSSAKAAARTSTAPLRADVAIAVRRAALAGEVHEDEQRRDHRRDDRGADDDRRALAALREIDRRRGLNPQQQHEQQPEARVRHDGQHGVNGVADDRPAVDHAEDDHRGDDEEELRRAPRAPADDVHEQREERRDAEDAGEAADRLGDRGSPRLLERHAPKKCAWNSTIMLSQIGVRAARSRSSGIMLSS